jgi:fructose-1,6-bisphosphatase
MAPPTTLESHVAEERRRGLALDAAGALLDLAAGVKAIVAVLARATVCGAVGAPGCDEPPTRIAGLANDLLVDACVRGGHVAAIASAELPEPRVLFGRHGGRCLVAFAPLDGASNLAVNVTVGTVFSVLRAPHHLLPAGGGAFLQPGERQASAGYALYGPSTMLVATAGRDVNGFTLDAASGDFVLTHPRMRIPDDPRELAIDPAKAPLWDRSVRRYVEERVAGGASSPGDAPDMRWVGCGATDVHRVLVRGGALVCPKVAVSAGPAAPRLVFEASPLALLVERAGGAASTGRARVLDLVPRDLHERVPLILGSPREVERLVSYHADPGGGLDRLRAG